MSVSHVNGKLTVFKSGDELVSETWLVRFGHDRLFSQRTEHEDNNSLISFIFLKCVDQGPYTLTFWGHICSKAARKPSGSVTDRGTEK